MNYKEIQKYPYTHQILFSFFLLCEAIIGDENINPKIRNFMFIEKLAFRIIDELDSVLTVKQKNIILDWYGINDCHIKSMYDIYKDYGFENTKDAIDYAKNAIEMVKNDDFISTITQVFEEAGAICAKESDA